MFTFKGVSTKQYWLLPPRDRPTDLTHKPPSKGRPSSSFSQWKLRKRAHFILSLSISSLQQENSTLQLVFVVLSTGDDLLLVDDFWRERKALATLAMIPKRITEPIVRFKKKCFNPKATFAGLTLREWAILNSILFFVSGNWFFLWCKPKQNARLQIMTTLLLTCAVLATVHRKNVLQLIQSDIEMEQEKIISEMESKKHSYGLKHLSENELKLQRSEEYVAS